MGNCQWTAQLEREFDVQGALSASTREHVDACPDCAAHYALLARMRAAVQRVSNRQEIRDPQFAAFMEGIRDRIETPPRPARMGWWAWSSIGTAALIVAVFTFMVIAGGPKPVRAQTEIESVSTELDGAPVGDYTQEDGATTVCTAWVNLPQGDVW